jgi:hypothetical protein
MSRLSRLSTTFALAVTAAALTAGPALARDHDRMPDKWEKRHHLNVKKDDSRRDRDRDGLSNYGEYRAHTNPRKKDSDHDGRRDSREDFDRDHLRNAAEIKTGWDPRDKDSDNDGVKDGRENAGKIVALSGSTVTIKLAVGGKLAAGLGDDLAIRCAPAGDSGSGSTSDESTPELDDPLAPGEDDDSGDMPDDETADESVVGDFGGPDDGAPLARASGEDDDGMDDMAFDDTDFAVADVCGTSILKLGGTVHKAKVTRTASGPMVVSLKLLGLRRR